MAPAEDDQRGGRGRAGPAAGAERWRLAGIMAALGGGHTVDTVPDDSTPYRTEDGGWSTKALDHYLDRQLSGPGE
jgi:hypothetical protein